MSSDFAHLHVHTEYSTLDGAAKNSLLFAEAARQGMPAVGMTDHGNMFGAYEFFQTAKNYPVKPIIGIEAYVAPSSRFNRSPEFWSTGKREVADLDAEGTKDVSGGGRYTHMTMWAENAEGLRNLFRLSSLASFEGYYLKPRMDRELLSQYGKGIIATTGCPSGEVQTRLRLGQYDEALAAAAAYRDIFGRENYFLEIMDHGVPIERMVREDLLRISKDLKLPLLLTNDSHYVTADQADAHDNLLCVGVGRNKDEPNRFRFNGDGYYLKTSAGDAGAVPGPSRGRATTRSRSRSASATTPTSSVTSTGCRSSSCRRGRRSRPGCARRSTAASRSGSATTRRPICGSASSWR